MRTIETKVYLFEELNEQAKQKALETHFCINVEHDWWDCTYDDAKTIGLKLNSFDLDRNRHATGELLLSANEVAQNIFNNHGESTETYKEADIFMNDWQPIFNNYMDEYHKDYESPESEVEMMEQEDLFTKNLIEIYSISLQQECEYLQSEEAVKETLISNEYEFTSEGVLF